MRVPLIRGFPRRISGSLTMCCFHCTGIFRYYRLSPPFAKARVRCVAECRVPYRCAIGLCEGGSWIFFLTPSRSPFKIFHFPFSLQSGQRFENSPGSVDILAGTQPTSEKQIPAKSAGIRDDSGVET